MEKTECVFFVWAHAAGLQCRGFYCVALFLGIKTLQRAFIKTNTALPSSIAGKDILKPKSSGL